MKKLVVLLALGAVVGALGLTGCSKSKKTAASSGSGPDATAASVASDSPVDMKIKWTPGRKYPMRIELAQSTKTDVPNQPQPVVQEMKLTQGFEFSALKELANGGRQLELKFETETMNVSQGGTQRVEFRFPAESGPGRQQSGGADIARDDWRAHSIFYRCERQSGRMEGVDELTKRVAATGSRRPRAVPANVQRGHAQTVWFLRRCPAGPSGQAPGDTWPFKEMCPPPSGS